MKRIVLILLVTLLYGCTFPGPPGAFSNPLKDDFATFETKTTCCFAVGSFHYSYLLYVDDVYNQTRTGVFYIPIGEQYLGLGASLSAGVKAFTIVKMNIESNKNYQLRIEQKDDKQFASISVGDEIILEKEMILHYGDGAEGLNNPEERMLKEIKSLLGNG